MFVLLSGNIFAASTTSGDAEIRHAIEEYMQHKTAGLEFEPQIKRLSIHGKMLSPDGKLDYEVVAPQQWEGWGKVNVAVVVRKGDRIIANVPVTVEVISLAEMVVAQHQIDSGHIITSSDIALRKEEVALVRGRYIKSIDEVVGLKARQTIRANTPIKPEQLQKIPLIRSGQIVNVVAEKDTMRITVTGKAKSAGALGDTINVQNLNSLKEFPAKVVDANTVKVLF